MVAALSMAVVMNCNPPSPLGKFGKLGTVPVFRAADVQA
jgi:hypothetical protein